MKVFQFIRQLYLCMKLFIKISDFKPFKTTSKYLTKGAVEAGVKGLQLHVFADLV